MKKSTTKPRIDKSRVRLTKNTACIACGEDIRKGTVGRYVTIGGFTVGVKHINCRSAKPKPAPVASAPAVYGKEPKTVTFDETCVSCGGVIKKGTEAMWDMDKGVNHLTHIPDCKGVRPGSEPKPEVRELLLSFPTLLPNGFPKYIRIIKQTHREFEFTPYDHRSFFHDGFCLHSEKEPFTHKAKDALWVRGTNKRRDNLKMLIEAYTKEWLHKCLSTVDAYNEKFGKGNTGYAARFFSKAEDKPEAVKDPSIRELSIAVTSHKPDGTPATFVINKQTHRNHEFTSEGFSFLYDGFELASDNIPEASYAGLNRLYVRGRDSNHNFSTVHIEKKSVEWVKKCLKAIDAYNNLYGVPSTKTTYYKTYFEDKPKAEWTQVTVGCSSVTCNVCQNAILRGNEAMWMEKNGVNFYCHEECLTHGDKPVKRLITLDFPTQLCAGKPAWVQIVGQTHRNMEFTPEGDTFDHNGFMLKSYSNPHYAIGRDGLFYVRGSDKVSDSVKVPLDTFDDTAFEKFLRAVDAYNEKFNSDYIKGFYTDEFARSKKMVKTPVCFGKICPNFNSSVLLCRECDFAAKCRAEFNRPHDKKPECFGRFYTTISACVACKHHHECVTNSETYSAQRDARDKAKKPGCFGKYPYATECDPCKVIDECRKATKDKIKAEKEKKAEKAEKKPVCFGTRSGFSSVCGPCKVVLECRRAHLIKKPECFGKYNPSVLPCKECDFNDSCKVELSKPNEKKPECFGRFASTNLCAACKVSYDCGKATENRKPEKPEKPEKPKGDDPNNRCLCFGAYDKNIEECQKCPDQKVCPRPPCFGSTETIAACKTCSHTLACIGADEPARRPPCFGGFNPELPSCELCLSNEKCEGQRASKKPGCFGHNYLDLGVAACQSCHLKNPCAEAARKSKPSKAKPEPLPSKDSVIDLPHPQRCHECGENIPVGSRVMWVVMGVGKDGPSGYFVHWPTCPSAKDSPCYKCGKRIGLYEYIQTGKGYKHSPYCPKDTPTPPPPTKEEALQKSIFKSFKEAVRDATRKMWDEIESNQKNASREPTPAEQQMLDAINDFDEKDRPKVARLVALLTNNAYYDQMFNSPKAKPRHLGLAVSPKGLVLVCESTDQGVYWREDTGGFGDSFDLNRGRRPNTGEIEHFLDRLPIKAVMRLALGEKE